MYLFGTLDPHPPTATPILGQSPKKDGFLFSLKSLGPSLTLSSLLDHVVLDPGISFNFLQLKPSPSLWIHILAKNAKNCTSQNSKKRYFKNISVIKNAIQDALIKMNILLRSFANL